MFHSVNENVAHPYIPTMSKKPNLVKQGWNLESHSLTSPTSGTPILVEIITSFINISVLTHWHITNLIAFIIPLWKSCSLFYAKSWALAPTVHLAPKANPPGQSLTLNAIAPAMHTLQKLTEPQESISNLVCSYLHVSIAICTKNLNSRT